MELFYKKNWQFELKTPDYDTPVFGGKIGELRLLSKNNKEDSIKNGIDLSNIKEYLIQNQILLCTFRGKENIDIIQQLLDLEFKFISTYNTVSLKSFEFNEIKFESDLKTTLANDGDFDEILKLESIVFDYSTFQIDHRISDEISSYRNTLRVKSYFSNPNHRAFVIRVDNNIAGFIQVIFDKNRGVADCVNGAISKEYQGLGLGPKLYSDTFKNVIDLGFSYITAGFCTQNVPVSKIFKVCNFKIVDQEIHLRIIV